MLAGTVENLIFSLNVTVCCCCLKHRLGVQILGCLDAVGWLFSCALWVTWSVHLRNACIGPIKIPRGAGCEDNVEGVTHFQEEMVKLSIYLKVCHRFIRQY